MFYSFAKSIVHAGKQNKSDLSNVNLSIVFVNFSVLSSQAISLYPLHIEIARNDYNYLMSPQFSPLSTNALD